MCLAAPKWGNDDDEADQVMKDVFEWTAKAVESETNAWGKPLVSEGRNGTAYHVWAGKTTGALPNGRLAWTHLADGGVSPMAGMDTRGPTAVINSVTKLDLTCTGSAVFNQKLPPGLLQGRDGIERLSARRKEGAYGLKLGRFKGEKDYSYFVIRGQLITKTC